MRARVRARNRCGDGDAVSRARREALTPTRRIGEQDGTAGTEGGCPPTAGQSDWKPIQGDQSLFP